MTEVRGRGRPAGRAINDDQTMKKVADIVAREGIAHTTAIRRVLAAGKATHSEAADIRRLQMRWKEDKAKLLEGAQKRLAEANRPHVTHGTRGSAKRLFPLTANETLKKMIEDVDPLGSAVRKALDDIYNSPLAKLHRQIEREERMMRPYKEAMRYQQMADDIRRLSGDPY